MTPTPVMNVPPPALRVTARDGSSVRLLSACKAPPLKVRAPDAAPRLVSDEIASAPPLMIQGVTAGVVPVSVQVPLPLFSKMPKPRYCAPGPISATLKVLLAAPPSRSVSAALAATTLPTMVDPAWSSSTLVPPVKAMASARESRCRSARR